MPTKPPTSAAPLVVLTCLALCLSAGLSTESPDADDGYQFFPAVPGSRYKLPPIKLSWIDAVYLCQSDGGHLVVINSEAEAAVVEELTLYASDGVWVGINDIATEGEWLTVQGVPLYLSGYDKWNLERPLYNATINCGLVDRNVRYFDLPCSFRLPFICERPNE